MKKHVILFILLVFIAVNTLSSQEGRELYESGLEKYRNRENSEAVKFFEQFRRENPEDIKEDDALWYLGRLYKRLERIAEAEQAYRQVLTLPGSNRLSEAAYDLAQLLYARGSYGEIIELLSGLTIKTEPDSYELRSLTVLGKSFYNLGLAARSEYRDQGAGEYFRQAVSVFQFQLGFQTEEADRADTNYNLGKAYRHLALLALSREDYHNYFAEAQNVLAQSGLSEAEALSDDLTADRSGNLDLKVTALGGAGNLTAAPGFDLTADLNFSLPLGYKQELKGGIRYNYDDFSFKTFNFNPVKTGDARLIQSTNKISADVSLDSGSSRRFLNTLRLDGDYQLAEDPGDNFYGLKISEDGSLRINSRWKTGLDTEFAWKVFPDYLVGGHKIDSLQADVYPYANWYFSDWANLSLGYRFNLKQYLEAKYDTSDPLTPSTQDRQYISNSADLELKADIGSFVKTKLYYEFLFLKSNNYDVWISDSSAVDKFMADYNDYLQHTIKASADFQWTERIRTDLGGMLEIRNYINYIARDSAGVFLPGDEKRLDLSIGLDLEAGWVFWSRPAGSTAELILQLAWDKAVSNMEYESSFDTNSTVFKGMAGVEIRLP